MTTATTSARVGRQSDVRARRTRLGLNRAELAALAQCSVTHLQNIEAGVIPNGGIVMPRILGTLSNLESQGDLSLGANRGSSGSEDGDAPAEIHS
jgi:predicted transcriptional regulator